jgi:hypothetical protein
MTSSHFNEPDWQQQADEARAIARQLPNPEIQSRDDAGCWTMTASQSGRGLGPMR